MQSILLTGYCDRLSVKPGDNLRFMVSAEGTTSAAAHLVRIIHGDENPLGPGFVEQEIEASCNGPLQVTRQDSQTGSFVEIPDPDAQLLPGGSFTVYAYVWPTLPGTGPQGILTQWSAAEHTGFGLGINAQGCLAFWLGDGTHSAEIATATPLVASHSSI